MPDFVDDKAVEGERDEELKEDDEFDGLPEDEAEASDSGSSDNSGSSSDEEVRVMDPLGSRPDVYLPYILDVRAHHKIRSLFEVPKMT